MLGGYEDVEIVGEAWDGQEAVQAVDQLRPGVVVMDINMPKMSGIDATAQIKARHPETIVIGLSVNAGGENQEAMMKAGATLLMSKEAAVDQLHEMIYASAHDHSTSIPRTACD
jgi:DNA-binding NarL/FixJ family response regulator